MSIVEAECSVLSMAMRGLLPLRELLMILATSISAEASHRTSSTFHEDNEGAFRSVNPSIDQSIIFIQSISFDPFQSFESLQFQSLIKSTVSISSTKREAEVLVCFVRYHRGYRS
jgi:hypothetical protein